jgi:hypothetical protein
VAREAGEVGAEHLERAGQAAGAQSWLRLHGLMVAIKDDRRMAAGRRVGDR